MSGPLLSVQGLATGYGNRRVICDVSLQVGRGEIVAILGHNGAGKSTLLKSIFGLLPAWEGHIELGGHGIEKMTMRSRLRAGLVYIPQGSRNFTDLTVRENLEVSGKVLIPADLARRKNLSQVIEEFPILAERSSQRAGTLSGGERQMLALASALIGTSRLILLDEPSMGLAPKLVSQIFDRIATLRRQTGRSFLVVEQKVREAVRIADRVYVLRNGQVSYSGLAGTLRDEDVLKSVYV